MGYANGTSRLVSDREVIVGDSMVYMGSQFPDFELPVSTQWSLIGGLISVNASLFYRAGLTQMNQARGQQLTNVLLNPDATPADRAAALVSKTFCRGSSARCTDYGLIQTVNSLRFQSFSLAYNVPREFAKKLKASSLSLAIQGSNLGLWTNYRGKDPNVSSTFSDMVMDTGQLPTPRTWQIQCRLGI